MCRECEGGRKNSSGDNIGAEPIIEFSLRRKGRHGGIELRGVFTCSHDGHKWPVLIKDDVVIETGLTLPAAYSENLLPGVPVGIVQDVKESELAHFSQCYKASVVMCRRALQLALEEKLGSGSVGLTLGPLLSKVTTSGTDKLLDAQHMSFAERVKEYGDSGAHRVDDLSPNTVGVAIHDTVEILNYLYR